jgi:UDP:flavonoid glycosyltransferase YjiC (YdhE family)
MTKFLFTTLPTNDLGLLTRSLPIARELAANGHIVSFCSPAPAPSQLIAEAGFENLIPRHPLYDFVARGQSLGGLMRFIVSGQWRERYASIFNFLGKLMLALPIKSTPDTLEIWNTDHAGALMGMLNEGFVHANCEALKELMEDLDPDVIVDFWNPFAVIAARSLQKPLVTVIQADAHPASRGFIWWKTPPAAIPTPVPVVNKVLTDHDLPPIHTLSELSVGDLTLVVGMPETDPLPNSANVTYIGPILWQKEETKLPDWIHDLGKDKPLIWVYSGNPRYATSGKTLDSKVVLQSCITALAGEDANVVLTTGYHALPKDVLPLPSNFRHEPYVSGLAMAERSDLLIHHGGYGSCQTGLYMGKPAVIIPTFSERESNARRVAATGAGTFVRVENSTGEKLVNVEELRETVRRVLSDPSFAKNAKRIAQKLRSYGGPSQAAQLIERFSDRVVPSGRHQLFHSRPHTNSSGS